MVGRPWRSVHVVIQGGLACELPCCTQSPCVHDPARPSLYSPVNAQGRSLTRYNPVPGRGGAGNLCDSALWDFTSHQSRGTRSKSSLSLPHASGESLALLWPKQCTGTLPDETIMCLTGNLQGWALGRACPDVSDSPEPLHFLLVGFLTAAQHCG